MYAADTRWRAREGVAMALQRAANDDLEGVFTVAETWAIDPDPLVRRAAVAAVCEPRLLRDRGFALRALGLLDRVTGSIAAMPPAERRSPSVRTLRKTLGYGWSVAVAALPDQGMEMFTRWEAVDDPDVRWIINENRKKAIRASHGEAWEISTAFVEKAPLSATRRTHRRLIGTRHPAAVPNRHVKSRCRQFPVSEPTTHTVLIEGE